MHYLQLWDHTVIKIMATSSDIEKLSAKDKKRLYCFTSGKLNSFIKRYRLKQINANIRKQMIISEIYRKKCIEQKKKRI